MAQRRGVIASLTSFRWARPESLSQQTPLQGGRSYLVHACRHHSQQYRPRINSISPNRSALARRLCLPPPHESSPRSFTPFTISRAFSQSPVTRHGDLTPPRPGEERRITFVDKEGQSYTFEVSDGDNLLDIAQANDLEMEGACGGSCACSTCHVIVQDEEMYDKIEEPTDDENDMLDLAFGLTETSRLGCQVKMSKDLDGLVVRLPSMTRNLQASDFADKKA